MVDYSVNDVASLGLVLDVPSYQLPPEAWSTAENVRIFDDGVTKGATWEQLLDTSGIPTGPVYIQAIRTSSLAQWLIFGSKTQFYAWDGTSIANITNLPGPYNTVNDYDWVGTELAGIPVLTNNIDVPQYWTSLSLAADLDDVPQWTADLGANSTCRAIRAFGNYLVALNVTIAGTAHPHGVLWSHPADPGTMPASWDYTDPTRDAGLNELSDAAAGSIVDGLPLKSLFVIYKENATWLMRLVGGQFIMQFDPFLISSGILAPHCAALTGDGKFHFVATGDDIIIHDGISAKSILDRRMRRSIFNRIDVSNYNACHVFAVPTKREMWFAYPEIGSATVTRALIWNYGAGVGPDGVLYESAFTYPSAAVADVISEGEEWDADLDTWESTADIWDASARRRTLLADPTGQQILEMDIGDTRAGSTFTGTLTREDLSFLDRRRASGEPLLNFRDRKFIRRVWPKMEGGTCKIRVGVRDVPAGTMSWTPQQDFDPTSQSYLDFTVSGRGTPAIDFQWTSDPGTLYGYTLEIMSAGRF